MEKKNAEKFIENSVKAAAAAPGWCIAFTPPH